MNENDIKITISDANTNDTVESGAAQTTYEHLSGMVLTALGEQREVLFTHKEPEPDAFNVMITIQNI